MVQGLPKWGTVREEVKGMELVVFALHTALLVVLIGWMVEPDETLSW